MSHYYLHHAFRFLSRQKVFTLINVMGLALSLACSIVLGRYLYREMTVDRHAIEPETMYVMFRNTEDSHRTMSLDVIKEWYEDAGKEYIDKQVLETCDICLYPEELAKIGEQEQTLRMAMVDSTFTHFFHYDVDGDANAMTQSDACWISAECAESLGLTAEEAKSAHVEILHQTFRIAGIFHNPEGQVLLDTDFILPKHGFLQLDRIPFGVVRVRPDFDADSVNHKLTTFGETDQHKIHWGGTKFTGSQFVNWKDYYFDTDTGDEQWAKTSRHHGSSSLCLILSAVLVLIIVVGVVNYINLYMVLWQRRQRESGVRRVFGRQPRHLFMELWSEQMMVTSVSAALAWIIVSLSAPFTEEMLGDTSAGTSFDIMLTVGILLLLPLLAMVYPFVLQLRTTPLKALQHRVGSVQSLKARTVVLGFQYFITFSLVIMSMWMRSHLDFLLNSPLGFDADRVMLVRPAFINTSYGIDNDGNPYIISNREELVDKIKVYTERLKQSPLVEKFCYTSEMKLPLHSWEEKIYYNDKDKECQLRALWVPRTWFDVFGVRLLEGSFPKDVHMEWGKNGLNYEKNGIITGYVANQSALKRLGYKTLDGAYARAEEPLIYSYGGEYGNELYPVTGIVNEHYAGHRTLGVSACIFCIENEELSYYQDDGYIAIRFRPENKEKLMAYLEKQQKELFPAFDLETQWMADKVANQYESDRVMADVYSLFSAIAVAISCLGLLGLSFFDIRQRYREIAIRKAHGAKRKDIYKQIGKKYIYVIVTTFLLSIPVTYMLIHQYTAQFVEHAPITPLIYIEALGIVLVITFLTLIYQLEKAARVNVADVMKSE